MSVVSIRQQLEWERKKRTFWRSVWYLIVFFFGMTGVAWWLFILVDRFGGQ